MILLMMVDTPEEKRKFVILYENYRYLMLKVAADILHDYQLAEDAVQEAFVRVAKHMENVGQPEETATKRYLITITKHAAIDLYRRRNRLQSREIYMDELPEETGQFTYMAPEEEHGVLDILKIFHQIQRYISVKIFRTSGKPGDCQNMRTSGGDDTAADCQRKTAN